MLPSCLPERHLCWGKIAVMLQGLILPVWLRATSALLGSRPGGLGCYTNLTALAHPTDFATQSNACSATRSWPSVARCCSPKASKRSANSRLLSKATLRSKVCQLLLQLLACSAKLSKSVARCCSPKASKHSA